MVAGGFRKGWRERKRLIATPQINHMFVGKQSFSRKSQILGINHMFVGKQGFSRKSQIVGINHMFVGNKASQGKVRVHLYCLKLK